MTTRERILSDIADEYICFTGYPVITALGKFTSYAIATRTKQFFVDNELEWGDMRQALRGKIAIDDNYQEGLIFNEIPSTAD